MPHWARLSTVAVAIHGSLKGVVGLGARGGSAGGILRSLECREARFQRFELLTRATQHRCLHIELLSRYEIESRESRLQHGLEVVLEVAAHGRDSGRHGRRQTAGEIVD